MRGGLVLGLNASARGAASPSPAKLDIRQSVHKVARQKGVSNGRTYTSKVRRHGFMFLCATYERLCVSLFARARRRTTDANFVSSIAGCIKRSPQVAGRHSSEEMARYDDDDAITSLCFARAHTYARFPSTTAHSHDVSLSTQPTSLGCFDHEEEAAKAYDRMMLWCEIHADELTHTVSSPQKQGAVALNFEVSTYTNDLHALEFMSQDDLMQELRRLGRVQATGALSPL